MTLTKYIVKDSGNENNIHKYINDERVLSVLINNHVISLRPIQIQAIKKGLFFQKNFLICTPSGSGKTLIGELAIVHNIFSGLGKGVYLVPYKALAGEKYNYFIRNLR